MSKALFLSLAALVFNLCNYGLARTAGWIPTAEDWIKSGASHGPWRSTLSGMNLWLPLVLLILPLGWLAFESVRQSQNRMRQSFLAVAAVGLHILSHGLVLWALFWTID